MMLAMLDESVTYKCHGSDKCVKLDVIYTGVMKDTFEDDIYRKEMQLKYMPAKKVQLEKKYWCGYGYMRLISFILKKSILIYYYNQVTHVVQKHKKTKKALKNKDGTVKYKEKRCSPHFEYIHFNKDKPNEIPDVIGGVGNEKDLNGTKVDLNKTFFVAYDHNQHMDPIILESDLVKITYDGNRRMSPVKYHVQEKIYDETKEKFDKEICEKYDKMSRLEEARIDALKKKREEEAKQKEKNKESESNSSNNQGGIDKDNDQNVTVQVNVTNDDDKEQSSMENI